MNKKGIFFGLYLVLLTLFMCGIVIMLYFSQQNRIANSTISPVAFLILEDKKDVFEIQENLFISKIAKDSLNKLGEKKWNTQEFAQIFKSDFLDFLLYPEKENFRNFAFSDASVNKQKIPLEALDELAEKRAFFDKAYSVSFDNSQLVVSREMQKKFSLQADKTKVNFAVDVEQVYKKQYSLSLNEIKEAK